MIDIRVIKEWFLIIYNFSHFFSKEGYTIIRVLFVSLSFKPEEVNMRNFRVCEMKWRTCSCTVLSLCDFIRRLAAARMNSHARTPTFGSLSSRAVEPLWSLYWRVLSPIGARMDRTVTNTCGFYIPLRSPCAR